MNALQDLFRHLVPEQEEGTTILARHSRSMNTAEEARRVFERAKDRLSDIKNWSSLSGAVGANFIPMDDKGQQVTDGTARPGLLIGVDIPGPGMASGDGYDWVNVEEVEEVFAPDAAGFGIRVRPAAAPGSKESQPAHFYDANSTSTFLVCHFGTAVNAMIIDRNTQVNTDVALLKDRIRNLVVGTGAIALFSKIQWQHMCEALLRQE